MPQNNHWLFVFKGSLLFWYFGKWEHWVSWKRKQTSLTKAHNTGLLSCLSEKPSEIGWTHLYNYSHAILVRSGLNDPNLSKFISGIFNTTAAVKQPEIWHLYMDKYAISFTCALIPLSQWNEAGTQPVNLWICLADVFNLF